MNVQQPGVLMEVLDIPAPEYNVQLPYSDQPSFQETLEKVATFVSEVYAKFPGLSRDETKIFRKSGYWFYVAKDIASVEACEAFKNKLKDKIISHLKEANCPESKENMLKLSTDYYPEEVLCEVARSTFSKDLQIGTLFPHKTCTRISVYQEKKIISLDMYLKGPPF